jgi:hypothetical protein
VSRDALDSVGQHRHELRSMTKRERGLRSGVPHDLGEQDPEHEGGVSGDEE